MFAAFFVSIMDRCNISFENLVNYTEGILTPTESQRIDAHLARGCSSCQEQLAALQHNLQGLRLVYGAEKITPSDSSLTFARNLSQLRFPNASVPDQTKTGEGQSLWPIPTVTRWIAQLIPQQIVAPVGVRAARDQISAQRLYETTEHLITLWEEPNAGNEGSYVIGQIYSRRENICLIPESVLFTAVPEGTTLLAEQEEGEFHVPCIVPGNYVVQCWLNSTDVLALQNVRIGNA